MIMLRIINQRNCEPVTNVTVQAHFIGVMRGYAEGTTNRDGEVHFDCNPGEAHIYIKGNEVFHGYLEGYKTIPINY